MRIVTDNQPFSCRLVSSATPDALRALARHLEAGDLKSAGACLADLDPNLRLEEAVEPTVRVGFTSEAPFRVHLPRKVGVRLGARLRDLAAQAEFSESHLSDVVAGLNRISESDWTFRMVCDRDEPPRDYEPSGMGGMWDVVLFHDRPSVDKYLEAWRAIVRWAAKDDRYAEELYVDRVEEERTGPLSPREAFDLLERDGCGWRALGYRRTPFHCWYGESHDWIQVWFEADRSQLIVHDHSAATGNRDWDLANFFLYRSLALDVASALSARSVAWDIEADDIEEPQALTTSKLSDPNELWTIFGGLHERQISKMDFEKECARRLTRPCT